MNPIFKDKSFWISLIGSIIIFGIYALNFDPNSRLNKILLLIAFAGLSTYTLKFDKTPDRAPSSYGLFLPPLAFIYISVFRGANIDDALMDTCMLAAVLFVRIAFTCDFEDENNPDDESSKEINSTGTRIDDDSPKALAQK